MKYAETSSIVYHIMHKNLKTIFITYNIRNKLTMSIIHSVEDIRLTLFINFLSVGISIGTIHGAIE